MSFRNPTQRGRNLQPTGGIRIDARVGEAKQFGLRNTHRAGNGEIIGGEDSDGKPFGTKAGPRPIDGSTLGNPSTPGLDRLRAMNPNAKPSAKPSELAQNAAQKPASSFMAAVGGRMPVQDGVSLPGKSALRQPAASPPASPQAPIPGGLPVAPAPLVAQPVKPALAPTPPQVAPIGSPPQFGKDIGRNNIETKGLNGAIADYKARSAAADSIASKKTPFRLAAASTAATPSPISTSSPSWKQSIAPVMPINGAAAPKPKTGSLAGTIADIQNIRNQNQQLLNKPLPALATRPDSNARMEKAGFRASMNLMRNA
jgi:hypothetical protein